MTATVDETFREPCTIKEATAALRCHRSSIYRYFKDEESPIEKVTHRGKTLVRGVKAALGIS